MWSPNIKIRAAENENSKRNCNFRDSYSLRGGGNHVFANMLAGRNTRLDPEDLGLRSDSAFTGIFIEHLVHARCCDTLKQRGSSRVGPNGAGTFESHVKSNQDFASCYLSDLGQVIYLSEPLFPLHEMRGAKGRTLSHP